MRRLQPIFLLAVALGCACLPITSQGTPVEPTPFFQDKGPVRYTLQAPEQHFSDPLSLALVSAALRGDAAELQRTIAQGGKPNAEGVNKPGSRFGFTALHYAMAAGRPEAVRLLVAAGADPEHRASNMGSPLLFAIMLNSPDWLGLLLDLKPLTRLATLTQQQLLFEAARRDAPRCLTLLLERGVPIDIVDTAGYTLLLRSLDMGAYDLSLWLLQRGASHTLKAEGGPSVAKSVANKLSTAAKDGPRYRHLLEVQRVLQKLGAAPP